MVMISYTNVCIFHHFFSTHLSMMDSLFDTFVHFFWFYNLHQISFNFFWMLVLFTLCICVHWTLSSSGHCPVVSFFLKRRATSLSLKIGILIMNGKKTAQSSRLIIIKQRDILIKQLNGYFLCSGVVDHLLEEISSSHIKASL